MGWRDRIQDGGAAIPAPPSAWKKRIKSNFTPEQEQAGMAAATMAADEKFKVDNAGPLDKMRAGVSMMEQGINPYADELRARLNSLSPMHKYILGQKNPSYAEALKNERTELSTQKKMIPSMVTPLTAFGSMISPVNKIIPGGGTASSIAKSAAIGGIEGAGFSEAENAKDLAWDTIQGASIGGVIPAAVGAYKGIRGEGGKKASEAASTAARGFGEGSEKAATPSMIDSMKPPEWTTIPAMQRGVRGVKGAAKALIDRGKKGKEFDSFIDGAKPKDYIGTDEDFVLDELLRDGPNATKDFFAKKSSALLPGQLDSDALKKVYDTPMETRKASVSFDKIDAGEDLLEGVTQAHKSNTAATGEAFGKLQAEARTAFEGVGDAPSWKILKMLEEAGERPTIGGGTKNVLEEAFNDLGPMVTATPAKQFDILQEVRRKLDLNINHHNPNKTPEGEQILRDARGYIDTILKKSQAKVKGDTYYSVMKDLDKTFFEKLGTKQGGKIKEFDPTKIEELFGNTKSSRRLWRSFKKAEDALESGKLAPEQAGKLKEVINKINDTREIANTKKMMTDLRHKQGPTSPEVQRQAAAMRGSKPLQEAVEAPAGFINSADQFLPPEAQKRFGKKMSELVPEERLKLVRFWTWMRKNPETSEEAAEAIWNKLLGSKSVFKGPPGVPIPEGPSFQGGFRGGSIRSAVSDDKK